MNMPNTVPNQRVISVHRERAVSDFLGIKNDHWQAAARDLGAHAVLLYLYLASNADGYRLALSPAAIREAVGMPASTYRDQFVKLVDKGYLVQKGKGNLYDFYEVPQKNGNREKPVLRDTLAATDDVEEETADTIERAAWDREINIDKKNNIINNGVGKKQVSSAPQVEYFDF